MLADLNCWSSAPGHRAGRPCNSPSPAQHPTKTWPQWVNGTERVICSTAGRGQLRRTWLIAHSNVNGATQERTYAFVKGIDDHCNSRCHLRQICAKMASSEMALTTGRFPCRRYLSLKPRRGRRSCPTIICGSAFARRAAPTAGGLQGLSRARAWALVQQRRDRGVDYHLYRTEILGPLDPRLIADALLALGNGRVPVLLCYEQPELRPMVSPRDGGRVAGRGPRRRGA